MGDSKIAGLVKTKEALRKETITRGQGLVLSAAPAPAPELTERAGALPERLQEIARNYVSARQKTGESLLASARWLSEARQEAKHGEWKLFLQATGTSDDAAERLLNIHAQAMQNPQFAESVRTQWIGQSAAALLALPSTPPQIIEQALNAPEPMKVAEIRDAIKEARQPTPPPAADSAAPDLADILLRLDAHGYAKITTRQKGMTTFYSFRDYGSDMENNAGEIELAEGELPLWLADLDSNAAYAQAKQERYIDAHRRFAALGWDLHRDGSGFVLNQPSGKYHGSTKQIEPMIKTLESLERESAKIAVAPPTLADLDAAGMPVDLHNAGYFWQRADPPTIEGIDGWRGDAPTVEGAIMQARDREKGKGSDTIAVFPPLNAAERAALIREAKVFIESGADREYPTIGRAIRAAARKALDAPSA